MYSLNHKPHSCWIVLGLEYTLEISMDQRFPLAKASILGTTLGGDHNKGCGSIEFVIISFRNISTDFVYHNQRMIDPEWGTHVHRLYQNVKALDDDRAIAGYKCIIESGNA